MISLYDHDNKITWIKINRDEPNVDSDNYLQKITACDE